MTEERFTELVNLYLDKEIPDEELELLKIELVNDASRQELFEERVRLEKAMRMAFGCSFEEDLDHSGVLPSRVRHSRTLLSFPRWSIGSGIAASFLVAAVLLPQAFQSSPTRAQELASSGRDPLDSLRKSEYERFASAREETFHSHASLASHMRLLGLRPEHTPQDKELQVIQLSDYQPDTDNRSRADLLLELQELRAFPEVPVLYEDRASRSPGSSFGNGFSASLVRY